MASESSRGWRPTRPQIAAALGRTVPDVVGPELDVLFCGINPGLYSGAVGHHFARPGNRFWRALQGAGFTDRTLSPFEERELLERGIGITNLVDRATAGASDLRPEELREGARRLEAKVCALTPRFVAFLGVSAYRTAFGKKAGRPGPLDEQLCGAAVWLLPNPSGLNAHYQLPELTRAFSELRAAAAH